MCFHTKIVIVWIWMIFSLLSSVSACNAIYTYWLSVKHLHTTKNVLNTDEFLFSNLNLLYTRAYNFYLVIFSILIEFFFFILNLHHFLVMYHIYQTKYVIKKFLILKEILLSMCISYHFAYGDVISSKCRVWMKNIGFWR